VAGVATGFGPSNQLARAAGRCHVGADVDGGSETGVAWSVEGVGAETGAAADIGAGPDVGAVAGGVAAPLNGPVAGGAVTGSMRSKRERG
jgi:hypothetical protein